MKTREQFLILCWVLLVPSTILAQSSKPSTQPSSQPVLDAYDEFLLENPPEPPAVIVTRSEALPTSERTTSPNTQQVTFISQPTEQETKSRQHYLAFRLGLGPGIADDLFPGPVTQLSLGFSLKNNNILLFDSFVFLSSYEYGSYFAFQKQLLKNSYLKLGFGILLGEPFNIIQATDIKYSIKSPSVKLAIGRKKNENFIKNLYYVEFGFSTEYADISSCYLTIGRLYLRNNKQTGKTKNLDNLFEKLKPSSLLFRNI
jgi:hypothetical protein